MSILRHGLHVTKKKSCCQMTTFLTTVFLNINFPIDQYDSFFFHITFEEGNLQCFMSSLVIFQRQISTSIKNCIRWPSWSWYLQLPMQSVPNTTNVASSNPVHGEMYSIQLYVIKFVIDLQQVCDFLLELWFPPPIKLTIMIHVLTTGSCNNKHYMLCLFSISTFITNIDQCQVTHTTMYFMTVNASP